MRRSYKFRLRPTARQHVALGEMLRDHCRLYNAALEARRGRWEWNQRNTSYFEQSDDLKYIREADPTQARWAFSSQRETVRRLDRAMEAFFRRVKAGEAPGYPRFRSVARFDSVTYTAGHGSKWFDDKVRLQGIGYVRVTAHRPLQGIVKTVTVKREGRRWFVTLSCDQMPEQPLPATGRAVGVDMGVNVFAATSDGELINNPRYARAGADRLAASQRTVSRRKRGSGRRRKAVTVVANRHRKVRNQRRDHAHKVARALVDSYDLIVLENLNLTGMVRRPKPRPDGEGRWEPNGAAAKACLNRSILDAGWGQLRGLIVDKAECAGRQVLTVDPRHTSQTCPECGHVDAGNRDGVAFRCRSCGLDGHADVIAATNILRAGLAHQTLVA